MPLQRLRLCLPDELTQPDTQGYRYCLGDPEGWVSQPSFYQPNMCGMYRRQLGKFLLRDLPLQPSLTNKSREFW